MLRRAGIPVTPQALGTSPKPKVLKHLWFAEPGVLLGGRSEVKCFPACAGGNGEQTAGSHTPDPKEQDGHPQGATLPGLEIADPERARRALVMMQAWLNKSQLLDHEPREPSHFSHTAQQLRLLTRYFKP